MSEKRKGIEEGPPIWVESVLSPEEYSEAAKKYPSVFTNGSKATQYSPNHHKGGKWRNGMGANLKEEEIKNINHNIDYLLSKVDESVKA